MLLRVRCASCGDEGSILALGADCIPDCPRCGGRFVLDAPAVSESGSPPLFSDDVIISWISLEPGASGTVSESLGICRFCGYEGPFELDPLRAQSVCPACHALERQSAIDPRNEVECPNCRHTVDISALDRGRTVICSNCKYFLGCVLPAEKRRHRAFWAKA